MTPEELAILAQLLKNPDIAKVLKEGISAQLLTNHKCPKCDHEFYSKKNKRKCPECKEFGVKKLATKDIVWGPDTTKEADEPVEEYRVGDRQSDATCRREPINLKRSRKIQMIDSGEFKNETKEFTNKVEHSVSTRDRQFKKIKVTCSTEGCGYIEEIIPNFYYDGWVCGKCIKNKARNRGNV